MGQATRRTAPRFALTAWITTTTAPPDCDDAECADGPTPEFIPVHLAAYRKIESELGIDPLPISINE